jgi:LysM repeat protein
MQNEKKICCRITPRRILGAIVLAATVVNLITVGAVFQVTVPESAPTDTVTATQATDFMTGTFAVLTATEGITPTPTWTPTATATLTSMFTATYTSSPTSTETATSTVTNTPSPSSTPCYPKYEWPVYVVQGGDWLLAIARATGSTDQELRQANCLIDSNIYPGQKLYVPRPPVTPTFTSAAPVDMPTDFKLSAILNCDPLWYVSLSVAVFDPQGVQSVTVMFSTKDGTFIDDMSMKGDGTTYSAGGPLQGNYNVYAIDHYSFVATDDLKNVTVSQSFYDRSRNCELPPTVTPTATPSPGPIVLK